MNSYVDQARQELREADPADLGRWRLLYEAGLTEAHRRRDFEGLATIALFGATCLHEQGFFRETVEQLHYASTMAQKNPTAAAYVLSALAVYEALLGDPQRAAETIERGQAFAEKAALRGKLAFQTYRSIVHAIALSDVPTDELAAPIPDVDTAGFDWMSSALRCWLITAQVAHGEWRAAVPWQESLRIQSELVNHRARAADAAVFQLALASVANPPPDPGAHDPLLEAAEATSNRIALVRALGIRLRAALLRGAIPDARQLAERLRSTAAQLDPAFRFGLEGYEALVQAYERQAIDSIDPPTRLTLVNLGAALAGMEAVALCGTQAKAVEWLAFAKSVPLHVATAVEWPVARLRVEGLLQVRAGAPSAGAAALRRSIHWCDEFGYRVEAALSRIQLGEVLLLADVREQRAGEQRLVRREGWSELESFGLSPVINAYAATRSLGRESSQVVPLTPRETHVLSLLSLGRTYRQIGEELGISWRTAQLHANHVYSKLGASGKMQAVEIARELNILKQS